MNKVIMALCYGMLFGLFSTSALSVTFTVTHSSPDMSSGNTTISFSEENPVCGTEGDVIMSPCSFDIESGTTVRIVSLAPYPSTPGNYINGTGSAQACATSSCEFVLTETSSVEVVFDGPDDGSDFTFSILTINLDFPISGTPGQVLVENSGACPPNDGEAPCQFHFGTGSEVKLFNNSSTSLLSDWQGCDANPDASICELTLSSDRSITATFTPLDGGEDGNGDGGEVDPAIITILNIISDDE